MSKAHEIVRTGMSLVELFRRFPDDTAAEVQLEAWRWPDGPVCPHCESGRVSKVASRRPMPYRCKDCRRHFSVTSHTVMHGSKVGAQTWIIALFLIVANPKGRSSVQLAADLGVTQKTAWHLAHRIRAALDDGGLVGFDGPVEFDETYIGGKAKNMHAAKRRATIYGRGAWAKEMVVGARDRASGAVAARHLKDGQHRSLCRPIVDVATPGARVFTDGSTRYNNLERLGFRHESVAHTSGEYVRDDVSTNGVENYWSHLKRTWIGTYHFWSVGHLHRYVDEHSWRFNRRHVHVLNRMSEVTAAMGGRSLTYRELTGSRG